MKKHPLLENILYLIVGAIFAFLILQILGFGLGTEFPVVSVVSGSMRHDTPNFDTWVNSNNKQEEVKGWNIRYGLKEGDMIIIIGTDSSTLKTGDVVVYESKLLSHPIIHRIIEVQGNGTYIIKGDNNPKADPLEVSFDQIKGKAIFAVPTLGLPRYALITLLKI